MLSNALMNLRRLGLPVLLLLLPLAGLTQARDGVFYISKKHVSASLNERCWRMTPSNIPNGADTALDDSRWPLVNPQLFLKDPDSKPEGGFEGISWMRLHIMADSSASHIQLALRMSHYGASRVFLDGWLLDEFGKPADNKDSTKTFDPQHVPIVLGTLQPGPHLLAIQYANWNWARYRRRFVVNNAGFSAIITPANESIFDAVRTRGLQSALLMALFGIFAGLAMIHFILYLYYRSERSNALFARFAVCMSALFLLPVIIQNSYEPDTVAVARLLSFMCIVAACTSLCALTTHLLSRLRWPLYVIVALGLLTFALGATSWGITLLVVLVIATPFHAIAVILGAMRRRVLGARILGAGVLFFVLTMLYIIVSIAITDNFDVDDTTLAGKITELILMAAILAIPVSMSTYLAWRFAAVNKNLATQVTEVERLSTEKQHILQNRQEELEREVAERTASLRTEKQKSDDLLLNILPAEIAEELKETGRSEARLYNEVSVLFTDFVDFTQMAESLSPAALVAEIDECFKAFDGIIDTHGLEKIKTVGDAYIAVSGMPVENPAHARDVIAAALEIGEFMQARTEAHATFGIRLGVHSGPVVAGIVGVKKFAYDIWGDTVNTAARMEQHSEPGRINISAATYALVKDEFRCSYRGELEAKHKGKMGMYFVEGA